MVCLMLQEWNHGEAQEEISYDFKCIISMILEHFP